MAGENDQLERRKSALEEIARLAQRFGEVARVEARIGKIARPDSLDIPKRAIIFRGCFGVAENDIRDRAGPDGFHRRGLGPGVLRGQRENLTRLFFRLAEPARAEVAGDECRRRRGDQRFQSVRLQGEGAPIKIQRFIRGLETFR